MSAEANGHEPSVVTTLRGIYTDTVVDHVLAPRGFGSMPNADGHGQVVTPEGDSIRVWLRFKDDRVVDACFWTEACAATIASGSMVAELVRGKTPAEALGVSQQDVLDALGGLPEGNVHCALLAVNALRAAVREYLVMKREPWKRNYRT